MSLWRRRWFLLLLAGSITGIAGMIIGKIKEKETLSRLYERHDFTLLDDSGNFFQLSSLPKGELALLVFTPDGIPTDTVKPFFDFSLHLAELRARGVEVFLVSRTNREIMKNFKRAARFDAPALYDPSGTVGRLTGAWPGYQLVSDWSYVLIDSSLQLIWGMRAKMPLTYADLQEAWRKFKP